MKKDKELQALSRFKNGRIAVLGDIMLDVYLWGSVTRISPEAPVPVINVQKRTSCPGGAANVMRNLSTLTAEAEAFGVIGKDATGKELLSLMADCGINTAGIISSRDRRTTEKCRVIAGAQQLLRADFEDTCPISDKLKNKLVRSVTTLIQQKEIDAVIFDDYAKGTLSANMLTEIISEAKKYGVITILDPKPKAGGVTPVSGLTLLKPNRGEAFALAGLSDPGQVNDPAEDKALAEAAEIIFKIWQPENLLISLANQGMILYCGDAESVIIPTLAREVFDVSGAGDTVAAVATLALATGSEPEIAAKLANRAAGIVVGKIGTAPILYDELAAAIQQEK